MAAKKPTKNVVKKKAPRKPAKSAPEEHYFLLPIGDWSRDGHGMFEEVLVRSNKSLAEVEKVHKRAVRKFPLYEICNEYEEGSITAAKRAKLPAWAQNYFDGDGYLINWVEGMADLWLDMLHHADPSLILERIPKPPRLDTMCVGYGLFSR